MTYPGLNYQAPGVRASNESYENVVTWGDPFYVNHFKIGALIDGASRDASNTPTTILRAGLLMGYHIANKQWLPYNSTLTAGQGDDILGVLYETVNMQVNGVDTDRVRGFILVPPCPIVWTALWTNDTGAAGSAGAVNGHANAAAIRTDLAALGFILDDYYQQ